MSKKLFQTFTALSLALFLLLGGFLSGDSTLQVHAAASDDGIRAFVSRMYTVALGRDAEEKGLNDWSSQLADKKNDGAGIAYGFIMSDEFKNKQLGNEDYVTTLYHTFFDREPDQAGYDSWVAQLNGGTGRGEVLAGFTNSQEFSNLCEKFGILRGYMYSDGSAANPGIAQFVSRLYSKALGREGEAAGINDWTTQIATKAWSAERVATNGFFTSDEFHQRGLDNNDFVDVLYATFFDRAADADGKSSWMSQLNAGVPRGKVILGFSRSEEFANLLNQYGLSIDTDASSDYPFGYEVVYLLSSATQDTYGSDSTENAWLSCSYNANGQLTSKIQQDGFGTKVVDFSYDAMDRLVRQVCHDSSGQLIERANFFDEGVFDTYFTTDYKYNAAGELIQKTQYKEDGSIWQDCTYTYDENHNLVKEQYTDTFWYDYYYDDNLLWGKYSNYDGRVRAVGTYTYHENGVIASSTGYDTMTRYYPTTYYNEQGIATRTEYRDGNGKVASDVYDEYDSHGNMVKSVYEGSVTTYVYQYDARGNLIYENSINGVISYEYDDHDNLVYKRRDYSDGVYSVTNFSYTPVKVALYD